MDGIFVNFQDFLSKCLRHTNTNKLAKIYEFILPEEMNQYDFIKFIAFIIKKSTQIINIAFNR